MLLFCRSSLRAFDVQIAACECPGTSLPVDEHLQIRKAGGVVHIWESNEGSVVRLNLTYRRCEIATDDMLGLQHRAGEVDHQHAVVTVIRYAQMILKVLQRWLQPVDVNVASLHRLSGIRRGCPGWLQSS